MKAQRSRYQHGSIRKVPRTHGFAWEFRYYATDENGQRKVKAQTFDAALYKTEKAVREAVQGQLARLNADTIAGRINMTFGQLIDRYLLEELPTLKHSTQQTNKSLLEAHIRPMWGEYRLADITAMKVEGWLKTLPFGAASRVRARNTISRLLDLAMLWEYIPVSRNPMELVKVKGSSKRQKAITILTPRQFKNLVEALPEPYNLMALVTGCLGLRVSETLALKWSDFDWTENTVTIRRVFTHGAVQESTKSESSNAPLPVYESLAALLKKRQQDNEEEHDSSWVFASPKTGSPYSDSTILSRYIKPTAAGLGLPPIGWHTFRHSYKSWMASAKINPAMMKDRKRPV